MLLLVVIQGDGSPRLKLLPPSRDAFTEFDLLDELHAPREAMADALEFPPFQDNNLGHNNAMG